MNDHPDRIVRDAAVVVDAEAFRAECEADPELANAAKFLTQFRRGMMSDREAAHRLLRGEWR